MTGVQVIEGWGWDGIKQRAGFDMEWCSQRWLERMLNASQHNVNTVWLEVWTTFKVGKSPFLLPLFTNYLVPGQRRHNSHAQMCEHDHHRKYGKQAGTGFNLRAHKKGVASFAGESFQSLGFPPYSGKMKCYIHLGNATDNTWTGASHGWTVHIISPLLVNWNSTDICIHS